MANNTALIEENYDMAKNGNRPVHEIRLGRIKAAIWEHTVDGVTRHNVTLSRIYKDDHGQWKRTDSFGRDDLLVVAKVADLANSWIYGKSESSEGQEADSHE